MPSHIVVNGLGLTYKGTIGVSTATLPDVCKTPSPGGPVPIPYPNFADQGSLAKGTTTVKAKGQMIATKGSEYSTSFGDEPGTAGGVTSSTFKKETSWITYSFDVKMDGNNACRHTDKKFHNHKNTVDLAGNVDPQVQKTLQDIMCNCHRSCPPTSLDEPCDDIGRRKHACCDQAIRNHTPPPNIGGEQGYDKDGKPIQMSSAQYEASGQSFEGTCWPDACATDGGSPPQPTQFFDFKFTCPKGHPFRDRNGRLKTDRKGKLLRSSGVGRAAGDFYMPKGNKDSQFQRYKDLGQKLDPKVTNDPVPLSSDSCK